MSRPNRFRPAAVKPRQRHLPDQMNKTEAEYAALLDVRLQAGEITAWSFESIKLRLADLTYYTPDFFVQRPDGSLEAHEVKGSRKLSDGRFVALWEDDARVKFKVAGEQHGWLRFVVARKVRQQEGRGFAMEYLGGGANG